MKRIFLATLLFITFQSCSFACTTFATLGSDNLGGGLLIGKARDSMAQYERLGVRKKAGTIPYLGLFYGKKPGKNLPYIASGVNQKGLAVVQSEAASAEFGEMFTDEDQSKVIYQLLEHYGSVAQVLKDQKKLFSNGEANFLIIGDKHEAILVEVGPKKESYQILQAKDHSDRLYHTNHYVLSQMKKYNYKFFHDSKLRFQQIETLVNDTEKPLRMMKEGYAWVNDSSRGAKESISNEYTVAAFLADIPLEGAPKVWVQFTSRVHHYATFYLVLNKAFWKTPGRFIKPYTLSTRAATDERAQGKNKYNEFE